MWQLQQGEGIEGGGTGGAGRSGAGMGEQQARVSAVCVYGCTYLRGGAVYPRRQLLQSYLFLKLF